MNSKEKFIELTVDATAYGGKGVARRDGKVYFVQNAVAGDVVLAEITEDTPRYANCIARDVITPSLWRGPSNCAVSDICGGCQWQGVPYEQQLLWKQGFVVSALEIIGKLGPVACEIVGSPSSNGYRNRVFLKGRILPDGRVIAGYFRSGSREFVCIDRCDIASQRINEFIDRLSQLKFTPAPDVEVKFRFEVQELPVDSDDRPHLLVSLHESDHKDFGIEKIVKLLETDPKVKWVGSMHRSKTADFVCFEEDLGLKFHTGPGLFQQVNIPLNHFLRRHILEAVERLKPNSILDVFCGSGNLSLPLAKIAKKIVGVEFSTRSIECAQHNLSQNNITNASYIAGDAEKFLIRAAKVHEYYDLILADPPREGMFKAIDSLLKLGSKHIIYVSCDPTTLARDLGVLCRKDYCIMNVTAIDFFPNTFHVETVVLLEKCH